MALPEPEPGLVISYAYLWHNEFRAGHVEGRKDRPSVIILAVTDTRDGGRMVTVLPITHRPPDPPGGGIELPTAVKRHLKLDDQRSWVMITEGNRFRWPGYDLRPIPGGADHSYGFLPPNLFNDIRRAFLDHHKAAKLTIRD